MTLAVYPLVYLPVAARLRGADPGQEEAARSLGARTRPDVRTGDPAAGARGDPRRVDGRDAADPGGVRRVRDPGIPDVHDARSSASCSSPFHVAGGLALSLVLVGLGVIVLLGRRDRPGPGPRRAHGRALPSGPRGATRSGPGKLPGARRVRRVGGPGAGRPGGIEHLLDRSRDRVSASRVRRLPAPARTRRSTARSAALLATVMALPVALYAVRYGSRIARILERSTFLVLAVPGVVIALALSYFTERTRAASVTRPPRSWCSPTRSCSSRSRSSVSAPRSPTHRRARRGRPLARSGAPGGLPSRDAPAGGARARRRVLPGVPGRDHRVDRDLAADPDRRADAVDTVLGIRTEPVLRPGCARSHWSSSRWLRSPAT